MKPSSFAYVRPASLDAAIDLLAEGGEDAKVIAGGQSLAPMLNLRLAAPTLLVDIGRLQNLDHIRPDGHGELRIGALARHAQIEHFPAPLTGYEALSSAAVHIGHPPIRTRGTFGGSIAHADPTAEWCVVAVLFGATVTLLGPRGTRHLPIDDFLAGPFMTSIAADEILVEVSFDRPYERSAFREVAAQHGDFATVAVGVAFDVEGGRIDSPRVAVGGLGPNPARVPLLEDLLSGVAIDARFGDLREAFTEQLRLAAPDDQRTRQRAGVVSELVARAAQDAVGR